MAGVVVVATLNALYKNTAGEIDEDIDKVRAGGADVIGMQEMGGPADRRALDRMPKEWKRFTGGNAEKNPVIWDSTKVRKIWAKGEFISEKTYVGIPGAGPATFQTRHAAVVRFQHIETGQQFTFISFHAAPSSQGGDGNPKWDPVTNKGDATFKERCLLVEDQFISLRDIVKKYKKDGPVIAVGDFNCDFPKDKRAQHPMYPWNRLGKQADCWPSYQALGVPKRGTHGSRHIDWVCATKDPRIKARWHKVVTLNSDHNGLIVAYNLDAKAGYQPPKDDEEGKPPPEPPVVPAPPVIEVPLPADVEVVFPGQCVP